jgi:hypothetical protein
MKQFLIALFLIISIQALGQNFLQKPYLEMLTVVDKKEKMYRLKANSTLWIKTQSDSELVKDKIIRFTLDSGISLVNHGVIDPNDIEVIRFRPRKLSRSVKQLFYAYGLVSEVFLITSIVNAGIPNDPDIIIAIFYPIFSVALAETMGAITYVLTPRKVLQKTNTRFLIKYRHAPPPYVAPSPYMIN